MKKNSILLIQFFRQLSLLLEAGIPILSCMKLLSNQQTKHPISHIINLISESLSAGQDLHTSMKQQHMVFDTLTCQIVKIGEQTGQLSEMLKLVADNKEKKNQFLKKLKQSLIYPCFIALTGLLITFCLFYFVIPRFLDLFQDKMNALPILTKILFYISYLLHQYLIFFIMPFILIATVFMPFTIIREQRNKFFSFIYKIHRVQNITRKFAVINFTRQLSVLFSAGITILTSLQIIGEGASDDEIIMISRLLQKMNEGLPLNQAMLTTNYFPDMLIQMVKIGEETGKLDDLLEQATIIYEIEMDEMIRQILLIFEPLIMTVQGVLIGGIVIGMYMPLFRLGSVLS